MFIFKRGKSKVDKNKEIKTKISQINVYNKEIKINKNDKNDINNNNNDSKTDI